MNKIVRHFSIEKETKNTCKFQEIEPTDANDGCEVGIAVGPLYIQKKALEYLGFSDLDTIRITIENID